MPQSRNSSHSIAGSSKAILRLASTSAETSNHSTGAPRPRPRFPRAALRILEAWVSTHRQSPYPTPGDLDHLTANTGLKRSQVSNWFANVRKRGKVPKPEPSRSPLLDSVEIPLIGPSTTDDVPLFHRWLDSWTEYEEAALPAILDAVGQLNNTSSGNFLRGSKKHHRQWSQSSVSSMGFARMLPTLSQSTLKNGKPAIRLLQVLFPWSEDIEEFRISKIDPYVPKYLTVMKF